jgi:hypothetical protein
VTFRHNLVRHIAGGVNILGYDNEAPSQQTNHLSIVNNLFDDMDATTWGNEARFMLIGDGADSITVDHNTILTTDAGITTVYGGSASSPTAITHVVYTNNMSAHNTYGFFGDNVGVGLPAITAYLPGGVFSRNVLAGGTASAYPANNLFPSVSAWQGEFVNFGAGDYHLAPASSLRHAATDGADIGVNVDTVMAHATIALSGQTGTCTAGSASCPVTPTAPGAPRAPSNVRVLR